MDATMEINDPLRFYARGMQKNATFLLNQLLKSACNAVVVDYQARQLAYARVNPDDSNSTKISFEPIAVRINDRLNDPSNPNSLAYYGVRAAVRINGFTLLSAAENARETAEAVKESEKIAQHLARATTISMKPYLDAGAPPWLAVIGGLLSPASPLAINPTGGISFPWFNRGGKKPNSDESQDEDPDKKKKKK
ncbi:MAG: hypothetical protein JW816_01400 [Candidatus Buchananbacteria bacterium]|nr:hypothetical protein [Candidatus Buchananbacteria bacterium]